MVFPFFFSESSAREAMAVNDLDPMLIDYQLHELILFECDGVAVRFTPAECALNRRANLKSGWSNLSSGQPKTR